MALLLCSNRYMQGSLISCQGLHHNGDLAARLFQVFCPTSICRSGDLGIKLFVCSRFHLTTSHCVLRCARYIDRLQIMQILNRKWEFSTFSSQFVGSYWLLVDAWSNTYYLVGSKSISARPPVRPTQIRRQLPLQKLSLRRATKMTYFDFR